MTELGRAEDRSTGNVRWGETVPDRARPCQTRHAHRMNVALGYGFSAHIGPHHTSGHQARRARGLIS